ncbi:hypothetical protein T484DRAFT_1831261, partial [Baffinella frigidus]
VLKTNEGPVLHIQGGSKEEKKEEKEGRKVAFCHYTKFERRMPIPSDVDQGSIDAKYHDGLLSVEMKKLKETLAAAETLKIDIK